MSKVLLAVCVASFLVLVHGGNIMTKLHYVYSDKQVPGDVDPNAHRLADVDTTSAFYKARSILDREDRSSVIIAEKLEAKSKKLYTLQRSNGETTLIREADRPITPVPKPSNELTRDETYPVIVPTVKREDMKTYRQKINIGRAILRDINEQRVAMALSSIQWSQPLYDFMNLIKHEFVKLRIGLSTEYKTYTLEEFIEGNKGVQTLLESLPEGDRAILRDIGRSIQVDFKTYACPLNFVKGWQGAYDKTVDWIDAIRDRANRRAYDEYIASLPSVDPAVAKREQREKIADALKRRQHTIGKEKPASGAVEPEEDEVEEEEELVDDGLGLIQVSSQTGKPSYKEWFATFAAAEFGDVNAYKASHGFMNPDAAKVAKHPSISYFRGTGSIGSAAIIPGRKMNALFPFPGYMCYYIAALHLPSGQYA